jgi:ATP-dependent helicase Lhr and Lhr-like helicase
VAGDVAARLGVGVDRIRHVLESLDAEGRVAHGEFRPGGVEREWCDVEVLRRLRRMSLAALRREVEPVDAAALGRFLPAWQSAARPSGSSDALAEAIARLQGAAAPWSVLERDVLPARVRSYRPADLDALAASGEVVWIGAGALGAGDGRVALCFRDQVRLLAPPAPEERPDGELHDALRAHLTAHGASFWPDIASAAGVADERAVLGALWDLVWAGEVTNDTMAPLRAFGSRRSSRSSRAGARPRPGTMRRTGPPAAAGRWSLVAPLLAPEPTVTELAHARAMQLLDRYGVVTREAVLAEGVPGGFAGVYGVLKTMEESGKVRRGYFVAGMGAAQFAHPGAVDRLRASRAGDGGDETLVLAATDPAQPYGAALPWPESAGRPARAAGAFVVLADGEPVALLERGARSLLTFGSGAAEWTDALAGLVKDGRLRRIELQRIDGLPIGESPLAEGLRAAGFVDGYRGLTLRG